MTNLATLPDIDFATKDAGEVEAMILRAYEEASGRTLAPGDPVRLFLLTVAAVIVQQRVLIDWSAKQNLLAYSSGDYLDHLGALLGVSRLPAAPAMTTLRFTLSEAQAGAVLIPKGSRATSDGTLIFATTETATIAAGQLSADVGVVCTTAGDAGNGLLPGQIARFVDPLVWMKSVSNVTTSAGGSDREGDERLRERIRIAPESFSVAGSEGAYQYWARTAHQGIVDVSVHSPSPGEVEIYPLMEGGAIPTSDILDLVDAVCSGETVRPLTDQVTVLAPSAESYDLSVTWWLVRERSVEATAVTAAVTEAVNGWVLWQKSALGRDINPSELTRRMVEAGAKRVAVASPSFTVLAHNEVGHAGTVTVTFGGVEDA